MQIATVQLKLEHEDVPTSPLDVYGRLSYDLSVLNVHEKSGRARVANERLRSRIAECGLSVIEVATHVGVDPKTVERWISIGRTPHPRNCYDTASMLGVSASWLWPELAADRTSEASRAEVVCLYPHRAEAPKSLWVDVLQTAEHQIDLLAYASLFFAEEGPEVIGLLAKKAEADAQVRIVLGDPDSPEVALRGEEEGLGEAIAGRIRMALAYYRPLINVPGIQMHLHRTTLYNSILRFDNQMFVNTHVYGAYGYIAPLLHLCRVEGGELFDIYAASFEKVWAKSWPLSSAE